MINISSKLAAALARCRSAVLTAQEGPAQPEPRKPTPAEAQTLTEAYQQAQQPVMPDVLTVDRLNRYASAAAVMVAAGLPRLTKGAQKLWELLHSTAVRVAAQKGYSGAVSAVTFSLPQSIVAAALGYTDRHVRSLQAELKAAGLIDSGAHAAAVAGQHLWATSLWAVKTNTMNTTPRIHSEDWAHSWRDLEGDFKRRNTAQGFISGLSKDLQSEVGADQLAAIAVTGLFKLTQPVIYSSEIRLGSVRDAVDALGMLGDSPPGSERRRLVQQLAGWLADSLNDQHSFKWWCRQLWQVAGRWEAVGALQAQLSRLLADLAEWNGVKNPAAWLASRRS